jgi:hypothetical protein
MKDLQGQVEKMIKAPDTHGVNMGTFLEENIKYAIEREKYILCDGHVFQVPVLACNVESAFNPRQLQDKYVEVIYAGMLSRCVDTSQCNLIIKLNKEWVNSPAIAPHLLATDGKSSLFGKGKNKDALIKGLQQALKSKLDDMLHFGETVDGQHFIAAIHKVISDNASVKFNTPGLKGEFVRRMMFVNAILLRWDANEHMCHMVS